MFSFIANIFGYLLQWVYGIVGQNYGIALLVFTVLLRVILLPITIRQQESMKKTSTIQGKIKEIQFKYKNNPEMMNKEVMELYKREKISPFTGCLGAAIQIIIILSVFWLVSKPLTYMYKIDNDLIETYKNEITNQDGKVSNYYEIEIIQKKSATDDRVKINMDFLGLDLSKVPSQNLNDFKVYIVPVLYVISSFVSIKMTTSNMKNKNVSNGETSESVDDMANQMNKSMSYVMPIMAVSIAFVAPLGLALYWLASNLLMIVERIAINKYVDSKEDKVKCLEQ